MLARITNPTPSRVVRVLVEMLAPYKGRVYDPCCGSGGMFVSSEKVIESHAGKVGDIAIYGQESNHTTWRLCKMNLAIRGIDGNIAHGDTFHHDGHPDLKADYVIANPPFNDSDWRGELLKEDKRWKYGTPPSGNANFAWLQHFHHHLAPNGTAGTSTPSSPSVSASGRRRAPSSASGPSPASTNCSRRGSPSTTTASRPDFADALDELKKIEGEAKKLPRKKKGSGYGE